ncbi:HSP20-like chaperone [Neocallimastix lanati (nom. inval.)]|nr:HSP20-like chaperone [Neocallimastix sp. JGI-2020a]
MIPLYMHRDPFFDHFSIFDSHSLWNEYDEDLDWIHRSINDEDYSDDEEREEEEEEEEDNYKNGNQLRDYSYLLHSIIPTHHDHKHNRFTSVIRPHFLLHRNRSIPYYPLRRKLYRALLHHNKKMEEKKMEEKKNNEQQMNCQTNKEQANKTEKVQNLKQDSNKEQNKEKESLKQQQLQDKSQENCEKKNEKKNEKEKENENITDKQVSIQRPNQDLETRIFNDFFDFKFDDFSPKINFGEDEKHYYLHADLPGMTKDQVKMEISEDGILTLSGKREYIYKDGNNDEKENENENEDKMEVEVEKEKEKEKESGKETETEMKIDHEEEEKNKENKEKEKEKKKEEKYSMMECGYGQFERKLTLPEDIDQEHISAKMENGALDVTFNKINPDKKEHIHRIQIQ